MQTSLLRLFNAVEVSEKKVQPANAGFVARGVKNGYILSPYINANIRLLSIIEDVVGISGEKANASFHKSWHIIKDSSYEELATQQIVHYITTYGFERFGIYSEDTVYIPKEELNIPNISIDIPLTVIKAMTEEEIFEKIIELGSSGIALSKETLSDIMAIVKGHTLNALMLKSVKNGEIKNNELKALLFEYYNIIPNEPVAYLRYVVKKLTGNTLLIKSRKTIEALKMSDHRLLDSLLEEAPENLASIFFRFKPLFLAMKHASQNKAFFNKLRKDANRMHKPLPEDYLNSVTRRVANGTLKVEELESALGKANTFRKIRLAYALNNRLIDGLDSIVYKVRNGKGWVDNFNTSFLLRRDTQIALSIVLSSIAEDMQEKVANKTFYIPSYVHYALPATEKQFVGNVPSNSYISVKENILVGIHWFNTDRRVDLDLSLVGIGEKIGWDASYYNRTKTILFSGDLTDAPKPKGASEFFYMEEAVSPKALYVNHYNKYYDDDNNCDCKLIIGFSEKNLSSLRENYIVDPNNILASSNVHITEKQNVLGLVMETAEDKRFYFSNSSIGNGITSRDSEINRKALSFMQKSLLNGIYLDKLLGMAGATVVHEIPDTWLVEKEGDYVDLSPEALDKTTIIDLLM